jgi:hypothetical protein
MVMELNQRGYLDSHSKLIQKLMQLKSHNTWLTTAYSPQLDQSELGRKSTTYHNK